MKKERKKGKPVENDRKNQANAVTKASEKAGPGSIQRPTEPRLPLMDVSALPEDQRVLAAVGASSVLRTLAHRPDLLTAWLSFGTHLTSKGRVPMRTRELLILRIAICSSCDYEWANHVPGALGAGVTTAEITALAQGTGSWSEAETAALDLVNDLCTDNCASEQTWKQLSMVYDEGEIIELLLLIGFYRMNAGFLNSLGVPVESGRPRLGQVMSYQVPVPKIRPIGTFPAGIHSEGKPEGTWHLKFYHPAATQELQLVIETGQKGLSGSLTNEAVRMTGPLSDVRIQGHQLMFMAVMTKPLQVTTTWEGTIEGDYLAGTVQVNGVGSFPFDGTRLIER